MVWKILSESSLLEELDEAKLKESADQCDFIPFKKGELVLKKNSDHKACIYVLLNS